MEDGGGLGGDSFGETLVDIEDTVEDGVPLGEYLAVAVEEAVAGAGKRSTEEADAGEGDEDGCRV